jgi:hypothetical protein
MVASAEIDRPAMSHRLHLGPAATCQFFDASMGGAVHGRYGDSSRIGGALFSPLDPMIRRAEPGN